MSVINQNKVIVDQFWSILGLRLWRVCDNDDDDELDNYKREYFLRFNICQVVL